MQLWVPCKSNHQTYNIFFILSQWLFTCLLALLVPYLDILYIDKEIKRAFTPKPMISFGSARKLNSYLVRANLYPAERTVGSFRSSYSEVFLGKGALKTCSKFTGEHPCRSVTSMKVICNIIEVTLRHGCSPVNLLHIFRVPFLIWVAASDPLSVVENTLRSA